MQHQACVSFLKGASFSMPYQARVSFSNANQYLRMHFTTVTSIKFHIVFKKLCIIANFSVSNYANMNPSQSTLAAKNESLLKNKLMVVFQVTTLKNMKILEKLKWKRFSRYILFSYNSYLLPALIWKKTGLSLSKSFSR